MNAQGQLRETFTRGVGLAGDPAGAGLVAVTHHAGSWTNGTFYTHHNHRGDVVLTRSGTITVGTYSYSAFGNLSYVLGPDVCRFKFSSKERDVSTGFYYYGYRFYAPQWQRWISRDPSEFWSNGELKANLFLFVGNRPLNLIDDLGAEEKKPDPEEPKPEPDKPKRPPRIRVPDPRAPAPEVKCYTVEDLQKIIPPDAKDWLVTRHAMNVLKKTSCKCGPGRLYVCVIKDRGNYMPGVVLKSKF